MVLWELTLATAYVLGLKRTYRLALRAQRRVLGTKYPRIRDFTERRTKAIFTIALNMHKEIQRRDISVGRNVGNWLLRMLDRARPEANIRGSTSSTNSQSGPGRPSARRLESSSTSKESVSKRVQEGPLKNSIVDTDIFSYATHVRGAIGSTIRSRITDGLKVRAARPLMRPLPALSTFGLWWQPVRRQSRNLYALPASASPLRKETFTAVLHRETGERQRNVFREDISRWIHH